ncbi:chromosome segregation ATPase [Bradyrhizobium sp. LM2.7]
MARSKTTRIEELETALAELRSRHSTLNERKTEAQSAFDQARADQRRFFLEADINDNGTITRLEDALGATTLRLSSLSEACAAVEAQIADAEQKIATEAEREEREAAAKEITATADALQEGLESVLRKLRSLGDSLIPIEHLSLETFNFGHFLRKTAGEIEAASAITAASTAWRGESRRAGRSPDPTSTAPGRKDWLMW